MTVYLVVWRYCDWELSDTLGAALTLRAAKKLGQKHRSIKKWETGIGSGFDHQPNPVLIGKSLADGDIVIYKIKLFFHA